MIQASSHPAAAGSALPENPVLVRLWRGGEVESQHRGSWVLVDERGQRIDGQGAVERPIFARSSVKSLQALPLIESGAAERYRFEAPDLALAIASHDAEPCHTERVAASLARLGLGEPALRCGPQAPGNARARAELAQRGERPSALHNNCSGKHVGFLALALQLGVEPERYLDPESASQRAVRQALLEMCGLESTALATAIDGCSAPTFRLPLVALATGIARVANPDELPRARRTACEALTHAAELHPELIAGSTRRLCTDLARATRGRLFPKIGAEGVYVVGARGARRGLALKIDDGAERALAPLLLHLLERFELARPAELAQLESWRERVLTNRAGLAVGHTEVLA